MAGTTVSVDTTGAVDVGPTRSGRGASPRPRAYGSPVGLIVKLVLLALVDAAGLWALIIAIGEPDVPIATALIVGLLAINVVYLSPRAVPLKYLLPGTLFLLVFVVYPVLYTFATSFTNYGTGNNVSKQQAIELLQRSSIVAADDAPRYELQVLGQGSATGPLAFLLTDADGQVFLGTAEGLTPVPPDRVVTDGTRKSVEGYVALRAGEANARAGEIAAFRVPSPQGEIQNDGFRSAFVKVQRLVYDAPTDTMRDTVTGVVYSPDLGYFVAPDGSRLEIGWREFIGFDNYTRIVEEPTLRDSFVRVFVWTFLFALLSVVSTFAFGLLMALVFNDERMRGRRYYRALMIIPYALPSFMTALVWRGMFNQSFGIINKILGTSLPWLDGNTGVDRFLPYLSILVVNLWLGYPYMFLVYTGALQGIPSDLKEAAFVDGATGFTAFRRVTFPLLLTATAPLLISSFAFNFNNFNLIYLLTEGRPPVPGSDAGRTDILISFVYKVAFGGGRGADYGFATALSVIIFLLVVTMTAISFRYTRTFEEARR